MADKTTINKWMLFISATVLLFFLDLFSKHIVMNALFGHPPVKIIGKYVQLLLVFNKGALFGFDPRHFIPWFPLNAVFFVFSVIAVVVIVLYFKMLPRTENVMRWGLTLILPGALGNLWDRIIHPGLGVVDFIRIGISETVYWPIFNLADAYVTIGVILIFFHFLRDERRRKCEKNS